MKKFKIIKNLFVLIVLMIPAGYSLYREAKRKKEKDKIPIKIRTSDVYSGKNHQTKSSKEIEDEKSIKRVLSYWEEYIYGEDNDEWEKN